MPWFRVDDGFHSHPKRLAVSLAAVGLWTVAGSWSSAHLTDGVVPDNLLQLLSPDAPELARELVAAGLWRRRKGGYQFHDWTDRNPSRTAVEKSRKDAAERQQKLRDRRRDHPETDLRSELDHDFAGALQPEAPATDPETEPQAPGANRETAGQTAKRNAVTHADSNAVSHTTPVPDPDPNPEDQKKDPLSPPSASTSPKGGRQRTATATRLPDDFTVTAEMVAWAREKVPGIDGRRETERFTDYWRSAGGANARKRDWTAAWRNWMRRAEDDIGKRQQPGNSRPTRQQETDDIFDAAFERAAARGEAANAADGNSHTSPVRQGALPPAGNRLLHPRRMARHARPPGVR